MSLYNHCAGLKYFYARVIAPPHSLRFKIFQHPCILDHNNACYRLLMLFTKSLIPHHHFFCDDKLSRTDRITQPKTFNRAITCTTMN